MLMGFRILRTRNALASLSMIQETGLNGDQSSLQDISVWF